MCLHVDDMLGTGGDDPFKSKLKELDKLVGLDSMKRQKFDHCGRQYEKHANGEITISMKAYIQNLKKASLTLQRAKQLDDELSATTSHQFRGINGCLQWVTKELLHPFQFVVNVLQRRQGQARVRDVLKANEIIDEVKQHEDFTLTFGVLDLTSCGLIGVSDASLGGVEQFHYLTDQDSKMVKIYSQAGIGIFIGENQSCPWVPEASLMGFNVILARSHECVVRTWPQKLEAWDCKGTQCSSTWTSRVRVLEEGHHLPKMCT